MASNFEIKNDLHELYSSAAVLNIDSFICPLCAIKVEIGQSITLRNCLHNICLKCLLNHIEQSDCANVKCAYIDEDYSCEILIEESELQYLLGEDRYKKYLNKTINHVKATAENIVYCKTENCDYWAFKEMADITYFICQSCNCRNCLKCNAIHSGSFCSEYNTGDGVFKELQDLHDTVAVLNIEEFECPICMTAISIGEGITLKDCLHNFCKPCMQNAINYSEGAVVNCPYIIGNNVKCDGLLANNEIKYLLDEDMHNKYLTKSIKMAELNIPNSLHCKAPDCTGWIINDESEESEFICPVCNSNNCIKCKAIHTNMTCVNYQKQKEWNPDNPDEAESVKKIESMLTSRNAMHCPKCKYVLTKINGCDKVTCAVCKSTLSWAGYNNY